GCRRFGVRFGIDERGLELLVLREAGAWQLLGAGGVGTEGDRVGVAAVGRTGGARAELDAVCPAEVLAQDFAQAHLEYRRERGENVAVAAVGLERARDDNAGSALRLDALAQRPPPHPIAPT